MDEFRKQRVLVGMVGLLVLLNLLALGTLWFTLVRPPVNSEQRPGPMDLPEHGLRGVEGRGFGYLRDQLGLSQDQVRQLRAARDQLFQKTRDLQEQMFQARQALNQTLFEGDPNEAQRQSLAQRIGEIQAQLELCRLDHFKSIIALCNDEQKHRLSQLLDEMLSNTEPPPRGGMGPGPRGPGPLNPEGGPRRFRGGRRDGP